MTVLAIFPQVAWFLGGCVVEFGDFYLQAVQLDMKRHWLAKRGTCGPALLQSCGSSRNAPGNPLSTLGHVIGALMATVIIGAGIIGTSTAYYLSQPPSTTDPASIHIVESSPELFASASGYAAGFLARDWFTPSLSSLGALSFDLHKQLAEEDDGAEVWGYSKTTSTSLEESIGVNGEDWLREGASRSTAARRTAEGGENKDRPAWLRGKGNLDVIGSGENTAQMYLPYSCLT